MEKMVDAVRLPEFWPYCFAVPKLGTGAKFLNKFFG